MTSPAHGTGVLTRHASGQALDVWYPDPQLGEPGPTDRTDLQHLVGDVQRAGARRDQAAEQVAGGDALGEVGDEGVDVGRHRVGVDHRGVRGEVAQRPLA